MQGGRSKSHWPLTIMMGFSSLLNLFLPLILVRILAVEQVGLYKLFFLYAATLPWILFSSGFANGIYFWAGQTKTRFQSFSATWSFQILWSLLAILAAGFIFPILNYFPKFYLTEPIVFILLAICFAAVVPANFYEESQIAIGETRKAAWYAAFWEFAKTSSLVASALYFRSLIAIIIAFAAVIAVKLIVSTALTLSKKQAKFFLFGNPQSRPVLDYALPASGAAALAVILGYCDQFILGHYLSSADFAVYSLGCLSIPPLLIFEQSVNKVTLPQLSAALIGEPRKSVKLVRRAITDLGLWLIPASFGLFFFAGPITRLLFTDRYPQTENFLKLYSFSYLFFVIPYDMWARAKGLSRWIFKTTAIFAVISLCGTLLGAHLAGAYGALSLFLLCQFALRIYSLFQMRQHLHWIFKEILPLKFFIRVTTVSLFLGAIASSFIPFFSHEVLGLIVMGTIFWIIYILTCVPWTLKKERAETASRRILILTQYLNIGGLERMILNLSNELRRQGEWSPSIYVYDEIPGAETLDKAFGEIPVTRNHKDPGFSWKLPLQITKHCREFGIEQIHAHDLGALIYAVAAKFVSMGRLRVVYTQHSFVHFQKGPKYSRYEKFFASKADAITTVSPQLKEIYIGLGFATSKIQVIENGIPISKIQISTAEKTNLRKYFLHELNHFAAMSTEVREKANELFWIINLARLHPGKGQAESIEIWNHLSSELQKKCLMIFLGSETSEGYRNYLEGKIADSSTKEHLIIAGSTLKPQNWLQASDLFISASLEEGLPLSPLEAMAAGLPVLLSDISGHQIFKGSARMFPLENKKIAAEILEKSISEAIHGTHPRQSDDEILKRFSIERMTMEYVRVYDENFKGDLT